MSDDTKTAMIVGWAVAIIVMIGFTIFNFGRMVGYDKAVESQKKWDCEFEFSNTPYKEIDGKCIKYFTEEK